MVIEDLKENYTKVSFVRNSAVLTVPEVKSEPSKSNIRKVVKLCLLAGYVYFTFDLGPVFADEGLDDLDKKASELYFGIFIGIAKWIIIVKGGWDIVSRALKEDFDGAKRSVLQYLIIFLSLLGLPYALNKVQELFNGEEV